MSRTTDTTLRIRAKNLAGKDLQGVSKDIDALAESQKKNATAAELAARSLRDLKEEQQSLATVARELQRRGGIAGDLIKQRDQVAAAAQKVRELGLELDKLKRDKAQGIVLGDVDKAIKNVQRELGRANRDLAQQTDRFKRVEESAARVGINTHNAAQAIHELNAESARTADLLNEATAAVERHAAAQQEAKAALATQEAIQKEITAEAERRNRVEEQAAAQRRAEAAQRRAELQEQLRIREELTRRFLAAPAPAPRAPAFGPAGDAEAVELARSAAFRERLIRVINRQGGANEKLAATERTLGRALRGTSAEMDRGRASMDRYHNMQGLLADSGRKSLSVYQRLRGQILSTVAAYVGLYQAANLVRSAVTVEQDRRKIGIQLKTANDGDVEAAARDMRFLRDEADRLGLVFEDVAKNFANYKIAAKSVGASNKTIRESFTQATEIVTGLGLSGEDADGVFRAFVQILGKARVQAEELRGQLGDRLPGAVAAFAKANNIALSDLDEHLKKGKGSVQEFLKFLAQYNEQTKSAVAENSQTLFAQFNRLKNAWRDFLVEFAKAGVSEELLNVVNKLIEKLKGNEGQKFAKELSDAFVVVGKVLLFVIDNFDTFVKLIKAYLALQAAKGVTNLFISFAQGVGKVGAASKKVYDFAKAARAAQTAGKAMTLAQRGIIALAGPLGIALAAMAFGFYKVEKAEAAAARRADEFVDKMRRSRRAQGEEILATIHENRDAAAETLRDLTDVGAKLDAARKKRNDAILGTLGDAMDYVADGLREEGVSVKSLEERYAELKVQHEGYVTAAVNGLKRYTEYKKREKAALEADGEDNFVQPKPEDDTTKDKSLEAAERLAERRRDIADRTAKALLDIEQQIADARIDKEATTVDQIEANYKFALDKISSEIAKKRIELEGMKRDAENIGATDAAASAQQAIDKLPGLQAELEGKAKLESINQRIALQEKQVNDLIAERDAQIEVINAKVQLGLLSEVDGRQAVIDKQLEYKDKIGETAQSLIDFLMQLKADPEMTDLVKVLNVDALIAKLQQSQLEAGKIITTVQLVGRNLGGQFSQGVASAFGTLAKGIAGALTGINSMSDAFQEAKASFLNFLADFLVGIGQAILQAILLEMIMAAIEKRPANYSAAAVGALTGHTGGIVRSTGIGVGNPTRQVSAAMFAGAQRFHDGGLPGLKPGEVPAILKTGEEVLSEDDPRNALNGGQAGATQPKLDLSIVNAIDSASVFEAGGNSRTGKKVIYNVIRANRDEFKRLLQD